MMKVKRIMSPVAPSAPDIVDAVNDFFALERIDKDGITHIHVTTDHRLNTITIYIFYDADGGDNG